MFASQLDAIITHNSILFDEFNIYHIEGGEL